MGELSFWPMRPKLLGNRFGATGDSKDTRHLDWPYPHDAEGRLFADFADFAADAEDRGRASEASA